ncbi:BREX-1 system phosphatase PglZ type A [Enterococcus italicus]|uniref:BREX-1 system phosphatase PglZ type A n=1 Tax=Enterococcus italicus TaxID=246144 RepID=UPI002072CE45|nr:BREX-1 system phosphatase PglZ type A [Enterococcus italicus]MCM6931599.1 BREX-1 system phosphatase PglZ type A [Enterococcus italicus]
MAELNLSQIQDRLNELFVTYGERKLIFWFDPKKEFEEDIDNGQIVLKEAQIKKLEPNTQFLMKRFFEIEDTQNSYLIYAPFKKMNDDDENNHLLSILKYSELFNADRIALVMTQLGIPQELHEVMKGYAKFFGAKSRVSAFEKMANSEIRTKSELELTLMAVVTKANTSQLHSIVQSLLVEYANGESSLYHQLENFELQTIFWSYIAKYYGYVSEEPTIQKLALSFFANTFYGQLGHQELPSSLKEYEVMEQTTAIVSFMDGLMNDTRYTESFDRLSDEMRRLMAADKLIEKTPIEELILSDIFEPIHKKVIQYYIGQLLSGDTTPMISSLSIQDVVTRKIRSHFGEKYQHHYQVLLNAQSLLNYTLQTNFNNFSLIVTDYEESSYKVDQYYRKFIWNIDQIAHEEELAPLRVLVEKQYKSFLNEISCLWSDLLYFNERPSMLDFYDKFAKNKIKTVVIISDGLRYEVAKEMQEILQSEKKYSTKMNSIFTVLPSVTEFGKAASLRAVNQTFEYIEGTDVRVKGIKTSGTINRDKVLKANNPNSLAISYEDVLSKGNAKELREEFNGQDVIYIYHDQIDAIGDKVGTESRVFDAVEQTIKEIQSLLSRISNGANVYRFIITSDHGFLYTRSKVEEHEKIENPSIDSSDRVERRFIISRHRYDEIGVSSIKLGDVFRNEDERFIHFPKTSAIFKKAGGGQSYVHGGASPQEMLVPVLEVTVSRGSSQKEPVSVQLMTARKKIIGLSISLEFYQTEAVNDLMLESQYELYFEDGTGNRISNVNSYYADSTASASSDRFTNFTFDIINRSYDINEKVYMIIKDMNTGVEYDRIEFTIDNPFAGGFGFDI